MAQSNEAAGVSPDDRYIVVSVDSHVGPSVKDQLVEYCDPEHLEDFHRFVEEMEQHGLLTWRSSEADKPGEEQGWSLGRRLDKDAAEKFAKAAGIRNADQSGSHTGSLSMGKSPRGAGRLMPFRPASAAHSTSRTHASGSEIGM